MPFEVILTTNKKQPCNFKPWPFVERAQLKLQGCFFFPLNLYSLNEYLTLSLRL